MVSLCTAGDWTKCDFSQSEEPNILEKHASHAAQVLLLLDEDFEVLVDDGDSQ